MKIFLHIQTKYSRINLILRYENYTIRLALWSRKGAYIVLQGIQQLDESLLCWIAEHWRVDWLNPLVIAYTSLGNAGLCFIGIALLLVVFRKTRRSGATALTAMGLGLLVTNLTIKPLITRPRPWVAMEDFVSLVTSSDPHSFPSGHTTAAFAFGVALLLTLPQKWAKAAAIIAAALMGLSRLYVGVHFPTDVLAGAVIGTVCGVLASRITLWVRDAWARRQAGR